MVYQLPCEDGSKKRVCKCMFMHTLGMKNDGALAWFKKKKIQGRPIVSPIDGRGRTTPTSKSDEDLIRNHINSYHPQISHYNREHAPNQRYLDAGLTITGNNN